MSERKERLTVTVDPALLRAAQEAVASGRADSVSAWVSRALSDRVEKERRLSAMAEAIAAYEAEFGVISDEEMAEQRRADRTSAVVIRGSGHPAGRRRQSGAG